LPAVDRRHHGRHDDQLARRQLPAVDRRHGHGRGKAPALARSMTSLPGVSFPASIVGTGTAAGRPRRLPGR
jgi:hypothetical protein